MRHMYDRDGNITYAGKPRASRPWEGSRYRPRKLTIIGAPEDTKAAEVELDTRTHQERIRDILNSSKYRHDFNN